MHKKGKFIYDDNYTYFLEKDENILYPYLSFIDTLYTNKINHLEFYILSSGEESIFSFRRIPENVIKENNEITIKISNLSLIELGKADLYKNKQNLIANGGFEYYYSCPTNIGYPNHFMWQKTVEKYHDCVDSRDKMRVNSYKNINSTGNKVKNTPTFLQLATADLISSFSRQDTLLVSQPFEGKCYGGIGIGYEKAVYRTEYLQTEFSKLKEGKKYHLTFQYRLAPYSMVDVNRLGIKIGSCPFTMDQFYGEFEHKRLQIAEGDYLVKLESNEHWNKWKKASFEFIAKGDEKYLTIGPFYPKKEEFIEIDSRKNKKYPYKKQVYYFIDDVVLNEVE